MTNLPKYNSGVRILPFHSLVVMGTRSLDGASTCVIAGSIAAEQGLDTEKPH